MLQTVTVIIYAIWAGKCFLSEYGKTAFPCSLVIGHSIFRSTHLCNQQPQSAGHSGGSVTCLSSCRHQHCACIVLYF